MALYKKTHLVYFNDETNMCFIKVIETGKPPIVILYKPFSEYMYIRSTLLHMSYPLYISVMPYYSQLEFCNVKNYTMFYTNNMIIIPANITNGNDISKYFTQFIIESNIEYDLDISEM